jgi:leukotriene-A4 hydrolase
MKRNPLRRIILMLLLVAACRTPTETVVTERPAPPAPPPMPSQETLVSAVDVGEDPHSYARPEEALVRHLALELDVDFTTRTLAGQARLDIENLSGADRLILDTRDLTVHRVTLEGGRQAEWYLGEPHEFLGRPLVIRIEPATSSVTVDYRTSPGAAAVQWLTPEQTAGGRDPFLFTQSQAILARSWVPLQDTPAVRMTYEATIRVPRGLLALMSAENPTTVNQSGVYTFTMPQRIPSYLMALAVGDLEFRALGPRSGVYAEPSVVERAAWEFADTPEMIRVAEELYGPYRWGRYDILVLPPSFPFGGMENPRLTFATPTIIAGDRSLVSLIAHELAHSWSGNLVTNATWDDFWLNEGFTNYITHRIMERVYGRDYAEMLSVLAMQDLRGTIASIGPTDADTHLKLDLMGRDPDEGMTNIAYEKGYFLLRRLEEAFGRERWDEFLRGYFDRFAFQSVTTEQFVTYLQEHLFARHPDAARQVDLRAWIYGPGLPPDAPEPVSLAFAEVEREIDRFMTGRHPSQLEVDGWSTHEWLHFLRNLPQPLDHSQMALLDEGFNLSQAGNSEILFAWLINVIRNQYSPAYGALERFLTEQGRRKFVLPLFRELAATPEGRKLAAAIYQKARPGYHAITIQSVDAELGWHSR